MRLNLSERSKESIWHPFTQMQIAHPPIGVVKGEGSYIFDENGNKYIDAISSWWTTIHGHSHPYLASKIAEQAHSLEHVIFAGFTHEPAVKLSERLLEKLPHGQTKIFYSDNGSTAVEVGLKMAFQYWFNKEQQKTKVISFEEAYHGDTFGAMAVGDRSSFVEPFSPMLFDVIAIPTPAKDADASIKALKIAVQKNDVAAIVLEPLVQGAGGMLMYTPEVLNEIIEICKAHEVLVIADEVMTGFYRTGKFFATDFVKNKPDIFCLSKGLTGGVMAMGVTSCTQQIYDAFLSDNFMIKTFFHGHSFTANPIACAVANASLDLLDKQETIDAIEQIITWQEAYGQKLKQHPKLKNVRQQGTILAFDLVNTEAVGYANSLRNKLYDFFISRNILMRPLGNTLYVLPPYCITKEDLEIIYASIEDCLKEM